MQKIIIDLPNGDKLVAEEEPFDGGQIAIGIVNEAGAWIQDLVVVETKKEDQYDVYVFGNENDESFTETFTVNRIPSDAI